MAELNRLMTGVRLVIVSILLLAASATETPAPVTHSPTSDTPAPHTAEPTTSHPTTETPTTESPTTHPPTTPAPTPPTTVSPTETPTREPTPEPTTLVPTETPTTAAPTLSPTPSPTGPIIDPTQCTVEGPGWQRATAGAQTWFVIQARDSRGDNITTGGADFIIVRLDDFNIEDLKNGRYMVTYTLTQAGVREMGVTLGGVHISGSPYLLTVTAGAVYGPLSTVSGLSVERGWGYINRDVTIVIAARDKWSNRVSRGGAYVALGVREPSHSPTEYDKEDNNDGTYIITFVPKVLGRHLLDVTLDFLPVLNSPFQVEVKEMEASSPLGMDQIIGLTVGGIATLGLVWLMCTLLRKRPSERLLTEDADPYGDYEEDVQESVARGFAGWRASKSSTYSAPPAGAYSASPPGGDTLSETVAGRFEIK